MVIFFSKEGLNDLEQKIASQRDVVLEAGQQVGEEAGVSCDWHDNFGFEEARRRLDLESERLRSMTLVREQAQFYEFPVTPTRVGIGCHVAFMLGDVQRSLTIGAWGEFSSQDGLVAYDSPIAKLIIGMEKGEFRDAVFQGKEVEIELLSIDNDFNRYDEIKGLMSGTTAARSGRS